MKNRPAEERIRDFKEVATGLSAQDAVLEALRCMGCPRPSCVNGCPVSIDIPGFIEAIAQEDFRTAARIIKQDNMLPEIGRASCRERV